LKFISIRYAVYMVMRYFGMDTAERRPASVTPQGRATALTTTPNPPWLQF